MPQDSAKKRSRKAKLAAKASIKLRNAAKGQKTAPMRAVTNYMADQSLKKAMKLNAETRKARAKAKKRK